MGKALTKLKDLAHRAGRWLGLAGAAAPKATTAVVADRWDETDWREILDQSSALQDLADDLHQKYDYTAGLLQDVFLLAYKVTPTLREQGEMEVSRLANHQIVATMAASPDLTELRRETVGDLYAAGLSVLAMAEHLRQLLEETRQAQEQAQRAEDAQRTVDEAAQAAAAALARAEEAADADGSVPTAVADAVQEAVEAAEQADRAEQDAAADADQALVRALPAIRAAVRHALADALEQVGEDSALVRAWGVEPGQLERMDFDQRVELAERLRGNRLSEFVQLIGRFRLMAAGERARRVEDVPGELTGVTLGDDLTRLLPSETAALGVPAMRAVFAARYAEGQLMLFESRGEERIGHGAIIVCVDCSYSMSTRHRREAGSPTREAWAKACALALLDQARRSRRDFAAILFSSPGQLRTFHFAADEPVSIAQVVEMAEHFYAGGTDFESPLSAAADVLAAQYNAQGTQRGDIVLITDGECEVGEEWMRDWQVTKARLDFRTFGIAVGSPRAGVPGSVLDVLSDNVRTIDDLTDPEPAADLFRTI
ncbi:VWA domain-containing protein [Kitasatospora purpeofusca]|uniref:VWA domain-containing protein n=1 Tax=Kitasatospora purpeofusca TaxID=67352 RepID=UPI00367C466A